ncbi:aminopeptidase P N-terminal domain-containing protein [Niveibacterium sp. 24ML]|uniref:aminopeptidase P N-terminal domain-containing protein n=1 Tax=Niveibacterium sp. 24ML TaxID=2985512 RepID=UPI00226FA353|nr:aminopeptidase P N-terminal domain-containing protein [Niveibacterium sp. 24ML]MCX9154573.1 aminopeptidase P N-terminal domain-containing protein [Niveibacterium sp. 24ML]
MTFDPSPFAARRAQLAERMRESGGGVAVIPTAREVLRNGDSEYAYRFGSNFYYLSGFREPEATLLIIADGSQTRSVLFCREKNPEREIWDGFRHGPDGAQARFGFDECWPISELGTRLPDYLADRATVFHCIGADASEDARIVQAIEAVRSRARSGVTPPASVRDLRLLIEEMRLHKQDDELIAMRRAAQISSDAHRRAMRFARPGCFEYQVEAELMHEFLSQGAQAAAYTPIVAAGANACVLHYIENRTQLREGDLLLIDAGCEVDGYAADITRTFPVSGRFSGPQRDLYELVLAAEMAAIDKARPGQAYNAYHDAAVAVLTRGLIDLGLLAGELDTLIETKAYNRFYMHSTGHWLGLDVHDVGRYKIDGGWRPLAENQVLTVEPGLYIRPADDVPEHFWNIGIRIEDDVRVSAGEPEILSHGAPKSIADIEALMRDRH